MNVTGLHWWSVNITWANVDPDVSRHMVSLGHNELKSDDILFSNSIANALDLPLFYTNEYGH